MREWVFNPAPFPDPWTFNRMLIRNCGLTNRIIGSTCPGVSVRDFKRTLKALKGLSETTRDARWIESIFQYLMLVNSTGQRNLYTGPLQCL